MKLAVVGGLIGLLTISAAHVSAKAAAPYSTASQELARRLARVIDDPKLSRTEDIGRALEVEFRPAPMSRPELSENQFAAGANEFGIEALFRIGLVGVHGSPSADWIRIHFGDKVCVTALQVAAAGGRYTRTKMGVIPDFGGLYPEAMEIVPVDETAPLADSSPGDLNSCITDISFTRTLGN